MRGQVADDVEFFFFNDTATTEIYTLSLHDALPISSGRAGPRTRHSCGEASRPGCGTRSEEHTSELQSRQYLVCRLLLEKKKKQSYSTSCTPFLISLLSLPRRRAHY